MLPTVWESSSVFGSLYSGGKIEVSGTSAYTLHNEQILTWSLSDLSLLSVRFEEVEAFALTDDEILITYGRDGLLRVHQEQSLLIRSASTVTSMISKKSLIVTGGSDSSVRVYHIAKGYLTHCFKNHKAPVLALSFHPTDWKVASSSHDYTVKVFDLMSNLCEQTITFEHPIRFIALKVKTIVVINEDRLQLWSLKKKQQINEIENETVIESLECSAKAIYIGDQSGTISKFSNKLKLRKKKTISRFPITYMKTFDTQILVSDQDFTMFHISDKLKHTKEFIGHIDEVLDTQFITKGDVIVALNTPEPKILNIASRTTQSLRGHTDTVICIDVLDDHILTAGKDNLVILWKGTELVCIYYGHTLEVSSVAISSKTVIASASLDKSIKIWPKSSGEVHESLHTVSAHEKDINAVKFGCKMLASASSDKTIKLWTRKLKLLSTLEGHKRAVYDISFHPSDKLLASCSADKTIKIWNFSECIRTLEGHLSSILKVNFLRQGLVSAGSDSLVKIWNLKKGTCVNTIDEHTDKVWSLATCQDLLVTGGADSKLVVWQDSTEKAQQLELDEKREKIKQEQELNLKLKNGDHVGAAITAFKLNRPQVLYKIITEMQDNQKVVFVDEVLQDADGLETLLKRIRDWNTLKKFCRLAQELLGEVFERVSYTNLNEELLRDILVYSEKHYSRVEKLYSDCFQVDHMLNEITTLPAKREQVLESSTKKKPRIN